MKYKKLFLALLFILLSIRINIAQPNKQLASFNNKYVIWAHSDIQPQNKSEREHYETAIQDIKSNIDNINLVILAGDIVQRRKSTSDYRWFLSQRNKLNIPYWYEIVGNHDARNFANYFKYIKKPLYYHVTIGNLIILFMSDEINNSPTVISDHTFNWWKKLVINNQDKIIITVTHAFLEQSELMGYRFYRSNILKSERFAKVLKKYYVDLWLAGHTSAPSSLGYNKSQIKELNNTLFLNISSIRREYGLNVESRFLLFENNSDQLIIKMRDHDNKEFVDSREIKLKLRTPFKLKNNKPEIIYPQGMIK